MPHFLNLLPAFPGVPSQIFALEHLCETEDELGLNKGIVLPNVLEVTAKLRVREETSLVVRWLRLHDLNAGRPGFNP